MDQRFKLAKHVPGSQ